MKSTKFFDYCTTKKEENAAKTIEASMTTAFLVGSKNLIIPDIIKVLDPDGKRKTDTRLGSIATKAANAVIINKNTTEEIKTIIKYLFRLFKLFGYSEDDVIDFLFENYNILEMSFDDIHNNIVLLITLLSKKQIQINYLVQERKKKINGEPIDPKTNFIEFIRSTKINNSILLSKNLSDIYNFVLKRFKSRYASDEDDKIIEYTCTYLCENKWMLHQSLNDIAEKLAIFEKFGLGDEVFFNCDSELRKRLLWMTPLNEIYNALCIFSNNGKMTIAANTEILETIVQFFEIFYNHVKVSSQIPNYLIFKLSMEEIIALRNAYLFKCEINYRKLVQQKKRV